MRFEAPQVVFFDTRVNYDSHTLSLFLSLSQPFTTKALALFFPLSAHTGKKCDSLYSKGLCPRKLQILLAIGSS